MRELTFQATPSSGKVSALLLRPERATWLLILGHGAGAGMRHRFLMGVCSRLADAGIATFRYQFPYMEQGSRRPNPGPVLQATVRSAVAAAARTAGDLPLLAGGKSMGGRMTSLAAAAEPLPGVRGLVFLGFPLHAPGRTGVDRADHLASCLLPMLFLQGTRDRLADLDRMRPVCDGLGERATLQIIDGGDHSFHVPKRSGRTDDDALDELVASIVTWAEAQR